MTPFLPKSSGAKERLVFNLGPGTVTGRGLIDAARAANPEPSFATAVYAEPRDWGYFGLLAFTAVLLVRPQDQIPGLTSFHFAEVCAVIGIAPMILHRFARRLPVFRVTPETVALIALGFAMIATAPFSVWPGGAVGVFTDSYFKILVVFVLMMNTLTTPKRLEQITWLMLLCGGYIAALSVANYARGMNLVEGNRLAGPVNGIFGNPNDLAMNMVTFIPIAASFAMARHYPLSRRLVASFIAALMLATVVFTKSRGGVLGLLAMFVAFVFLGQKVRRGFGTAAIVGVLVATPFMPASFWERMSTIANDQKDKEEFTGTRETRRDLMEAGIRVFLERPLTGVGAGQFQSYNPPWRKQQWRETHNALIQVAAETGLLGLLAFSFLIVSAAVAVMKTRHMLARPRRRRAPDPLKLVMTDRDRRSMSVLSVGMAAGLCGWFVSAFFASVAYNWTFYYLLALIVSCRELARDRLAAARTIQARTVKAGSVPSARAFPAMVPRA